MKGINRVAIVGGGFMGVEIALVASKKAENEVKIYDISAEVLKKGQGISQESLDKQVAAGAINQEQKEEILKRISFCEDLAPALSGVDLVIEAVPEILELKQKVFSEVDSLVPPQAIIATNSSSIPISRIENATKRPDKVMNIHFYPPIEKRNIVDLMGGTQTSIETFKVAEEWVKSLGCLSLRVKKELIGFCFNRVWHAARLEALKMWAGEYVDFMDIDRAWMICTGTSMGPFAMMDAIGLDVVYQVHTTYFNEYGDAFYKPPDALKEMVEKGELGVKTGKGFYTYPDPFYARPDFLKP